MSNKTMSQWGVSFTNTLPRFVSALAALLTMLSTACATDTDTDNPPVLARTPPSVYKIGPEDVLQISVWKEPDLTREVLVRPDGQISFPLAGDVKAAGQSPEDVQQEITRRLQRYIPDPVVTVTVVTVGGNKVYVIGQVNNPGAYVIGRYVDVLQALTMAGGLTAFASENNIRVLRREGGREIVFPFEYAEVKKGKNLEQNVILKGGDTVVVP